MTRRIFAALVALGTAPAPCVTAASPQTPQHSLTAAGAPAPTRSQTPESEYVIGPGDLLSLMVWREQTLSGDALVRPDGRISVPLLDDIEAAGLTPAQLRDRLVAELRRFVTNPVVTVMVKQINSRKVFIVGSVAHPGQYPLIGSMTVLQLIATAGGLQDYAKSRKIRIRRIENGRTVALQADYERLTSGKGDDLELRTGDTVIVP